MYVYTIYYYWQTRRHVNDSVFNSLSTDVSPMSDTENQDDDDPDYIPEFEMTAV